MRGSCLASRTDGGHVESWGKTIGAVTGPSDKGPGSGRGEHGRGFFSRASGKGTLLDSCDSTLRAWLSYSVAGVGPQNSELIDVFYCKLFSLPPPCFSSRRK